LAGDSTITRDFFEADFAIKKHTYKYLAPDFTRGLPSRAGKPLVPEPLFGYFDYKI
jgi:hypothetical protein